jgi:ADP-heptose:LPS heptosyltransferase
MENVFIFQVRRIGDFFQSVPLIEYFYKKPGANIDVLVNDDIAAASEILDENANLLTYRNIFDVFTSGGKIPLNSLSGLYPSDFINFSAKFMPFLEKYLEKYDIAVNLNYDPVNAFFMDFFKNEKKGFIAANRSFKNSTVILRSGAANYLFNSVRHRNLNKINITDIFSLAGTGKTAEIKKTYGIIKLKKSKKNGAGPARICVSTGATSIKRVWHASYYARLIELIIISLNFNAEITLVGTAKESDAAKEIKSLLPPEALAKIIDLTGKTTANELIYFIKDFDLLISPDTGTLHIAQIFNVPSVSIFTGNANFYETGPHVKESAVIYSKIVCYPCLEHEPCKFNYACKNDIKPEDVLGLVLLKLKAKDKSEGKAYLKRIESKIKANIKNGNFSVSFCKHLDSIHFYPLVKKGADKDELASEIMKFSWLAVLSGNEVKPDSDKILRNTKKYYTINKITVKTLISEMSFIKGAFENGKRAFIDKDNADDVFFERFKESLRSTCYSYGYLKLVFDYFADEIKSVGNLKAFNDIILLLDNSVKILKTF